MGDVIRCLTWLRQSASGSGGRQRVDDLLADRRGHWWWSCLRVRRPDDGGRGTTWCGRSWRAGYQLHNIDLDETWAPGERRQAADRLRGWRRRYTNLYLHFTARTPRTWTKLTITQPPWKIIARCLHLPSIFGPRLDRVNTPGYTDVIVTMTSRHCAHTQTERWTKIQTCLEVFSTMGISIHCNIRGVSTDWCTTLFRLATFLYFYFKHLKWLVLKGQSGIQHAIISPQNHFCCFRVLTHIALT